MSTEHIDHIPSPSSVQEEGPLAVLVDLGALRTKLAEVKDAEETERQRHVRAMAALATQRLNYDTTLSVLKGFYLPAAANLQVPPPSATRETSAPLQSANDANPPGTKQKNEADEEDPTEESYDETQDGEDAPRKRAKRGVLKRAVLALLERKDTFLATEDFKKSFKEDPFLKEYSDKRITDSLKDARRSEVIGIQVYVGAFPKYINGLPRFYEDIKSLRLKPEYAQKLQVRLTEFGMTLEKQAPGEPKPSTLFPSLGLREASASLHKETAPVEAGAVFEQGSDAP